jgi:hypothetical protein
MFDTLKEVIKTFSYKSVIKSNILGVNTSTFSPISSNSLTLAGGRNTSPSSVSMSNKFLGTYYLRMQEIKDYEVTELTNTVVGIFRDYIVNYFNKEDSIVTLKNNDTVTQEKINKVFKQLDIVDEIRTHLFELIYDGAYCIKIDYDKDSQKFVKYHLHQPYNVVTVRKKGEVVKHLVVSRDGKVVEVAPYSIIRFGKADLHLINNLGEDYKTNEDDTLVKEYDLVAGFPLYYNICSKIKEFILKDQLVSLLSIKDLIQPLLLLINVDKSTSPDEANRLALNTENLINKYSDISSILSANFSINDLIDSIINNIRVLPDYSSSMGNLNTVDLSKISDKINDIRNYQDTTKDDILTSLGIPRSLFSGEVTKWEAIKTSERLNSKINSIIIGISEGVKETAANIYHLLTGKTMSVDDIKVSLFSKTQVDYNTEISNADIVNTLVMSINQILDSVMQTAQSARFIDPNAYSQYIIDQLKNIDPKIAALVTPNGISEMLNQNNQ